VIKGLAIDYSDEKGQQNDALLGHLDALLSASRRMSQSSRRVTQIPDFKRYALLFTTVARGLWL
jgi:hypothetical protein